MFTVSKYNNYIHIQCIYIYIYVSVYTFALYIYIILFHKKFNLIMKIYPIVTTIIVTVIV